MALNKGVHKKFYTPVFYIFVTNDTVIYGKTVLFKRALFQALGQCAYAKFRENNDAVAAFGHHQAGLVVIAGYIQMVEHMLSYFVSQVVGIVKRSEFWMQGDETLIFQILKEYLIFMAKRGILSENRIVYGLFCLFENRSRNVSDHIRCGK